MPCGKSRAFTQTPVNTHLHKLLTHKVRVLGTIASGARWWWGSGWTAGLAAGPGSGHGPSKGGRQGAGRGQGWPSSRPHTHAHSRACPCTGPRCGSGWQSGWAVVKGHRVTIAVPGTCTTQSSMGRRR
jgi:hypothetical protein